MINSQVIEEKTGVKRNVFYNLEEIKVRWKKAALENCPGVPCPFLSAPGSCSSLVATPTGPYSASVSFIPPTTDGGSPITGYIVTATSTPSAPAKRKSSAIITVSGTSSPIVVTGLTFGVNYIFSVVATNAVGPSPAITTPTTVTPCVLNTVSAGSSTPTLAVNVALTNITHTTTIATGIGTVTGLPAGVTTSWSANVITISGTPTSTGSFSYIILLTGGCGIVNATGTITVSAVTVPGAPTSVVATAGNTTASVAFVAPSSNGGSVITGYTVTSSPAGVTATGSSSPLTVTGLTNGTAYTFTVVATNALGSSAASAASSAVTPVTVPGAPTSVVATAGNTTASVAFVAPSSTGGSVITGYTVTSNPGSITAMGTTSPINVSGLTNGTAYTFTVVATNAVGSSAASAASSAVTPAAPFTCGTSTVSDVDNNSYNTVLIGTQCWTKTNLKVTKYNDNTSIPLNNTYTSGTVSTVWQGLTTGAYAIYGNESSSGANATNYGFLYNWYASKGIATTGSTTYKNICPTGYHVPTDSDWNKLVKFIDPLNADISSTSSTQSTTAGTKLKKNDALWTTNTGTDDYGFSGLPGGYRSSVGSFATISLDAFFWSATVYVYDFAWYRSLSLSNGNVYRGTSNKSVGASVRCLRN